MIEISFDQDMLEQARRKLGQMESGAPKVLKNAVNQTARQARKDLADEAQKTYAVKAGGFNRQMKIRNAVQSNLEAVISTAGEHLPMKSFSVRVSGQEIRVLINKKNGRKKLYGKYFVNNIARKGQVRKRTTGKGAAGSAVKHLAVAAREGRSRLKIHEKFSVSIPQMIGNERDVYGIVKPHMEENLRRNIEAQVREILGG